MRARNLKPGFFKNDALAECDALARILFSGLWCMADRDGRMELRPKRIKAEILPYDNCDIYKLLQQLSDRGFIVAYKHDLNIFLSIPTFREHQNPHIKEAESTISAPDKTGACTILTRLNPESLLLNPDSPSPHPVKGVCNTSFNQEHFDKFWEVYPKKRSKGDAEKAWQKIKPSELLLGEILTAVQRAKTSAEWLREGGRYIPKPESWLNGKGWEDEYAGGERGRNTGNNGGRSPGAPGAKAQGTGAAGDSKDRGEYPVDLVVTGYGD